ncbi:hypothetical protein [Telluribacter sp.]|jgi:hypothetical protein|uniref:hypothetical protein n=1 Tax=Telluribacter sp. TaxID=1978767 RepID=UPI002E160CE9|nr:hypothetical protein [Telluribacter sp.]
MIKHTLLWGLLLLVSTLALPVHAQLTKGTRYWGGTVSSQGGISKSKGEINTYEGKGSFLSIQPELQFGRFRNASTMLGVGVRYSFRPEGSEDLTSKTQYRYLNQSIALLPYFRKYRTLNDRWWLFLHTELGTGYRWEFTRASGVGYSNSREAKSWQHELGIKPGIVYHFPKKGWAIEGYANILSLSAFYTPKSPDQHRFSFTTNAGTAVPRYITLRIARYSTPTSN